MPHNSQHFINNLYQDESRSAKSKANRSIIERQRHRVLSQGSTKPEILAYIHIGVSRPSLESISTPSFVCSTLSPGDKPRVLVISVSVAVQKNNNYHKSHLIIPLAESPKKCVGSDSGPNTWGCITWRCSLRWHGWSTTQGWTVRDPAEGAGLLADQTVRTCVEGQRTLNLASCEGPVREESSRGTPRSAGHMGCS
jgi:hypothetical protein